eukprot:Hpha_TRINITY_DN16371_c3_g1::TRINITY_DN16371_c3_g1_i1::g.58528::m.58528
MSGPCRWGCLVREGDSKEDARIKTTVFPFALFTFMFYIVFIFYVLQTSHLMMSVFGGCFMSLAMAVFMAGVVSNAVPARYLLDQFLAVGTLGFCFNDLANATISYSFRSWTFVVLALDIALVFKRDHMPRFIIAFVLVYITALSVESAQRFGLYEAGYWGSEGVEI